jgi:hypothetical protein
MVRIVLFCTPQRRIQMGISSDKDKKGSKERDVAGNKLSPRSVEEQEAPEQERLTRPDEEADMAVHQLEDPPQAEGSR